MVRTKRLAAWLVVAITALGPIPQPAHAGGFGSIGGMHIGGFGGLKIPSMGGLKIPSMGGFRVPSMGGMRVPSMGGMRGFSGVGKLPSVGSIGRLPSGSALRGMSRMPSGSGMRALSSVGSLRGTSSLGRLNASGAHNSFAMRHLGAGNLGRTGTALTNVNSGISRTGLNSAGLNSRAVGNTFLSAHAVPGSGSAAMARATSGKTSFGPLVSVRQVGLSTPVNATAAATSFSYRAGLANARVLPGAVQVQVNAPMVNAAGQQWCMGGWMGLTTWDQRLSHLGLSGGLIPRRIFLGLSGWFPYYPYFRGYYGYGAGSGYGYGPGCYCGPTGYSPYQTAVANNGAPVATDSTVMTSPTNDELKDEFLLQGEDDFRAGNYQAAARDWRHAMLDNPNNRGIGLLLSQALFATGQYDEAAGALQYAMQSLPPEKWGVVVTNYTELYRNNQDYCDQLLALENTAKSKATDSPAVRFLLGYHYAYLGYPVHAVRELNKTLAAAPGDGLAAQLRDLMQKQLPAPR